MYPISKSLTIYLFKRDVRFFGINETLSIAKHTLAKILSATDQYLKSLRIVLEKHNWFRITETQHSNL